MGKGTLGTALHTHLSDLSESSEMGKSTSTIWLSICTSSCFTSRKDEHVKQRRVSLIYGVKVKLHSEQKGYVIIKIRNCQNCLIIFAYHSLVMLLVLMLFT